MLRERSRVAVTGLSGVYTHRSRSGVTNPCPPPRPRWAARSSPSPRGRPTPAARLRDRHRRARRRTPSTGNAPLHRLAAARRRRLERDLLPRVALDHGRRDQPEPRGDGDRRLRRGLGDPGNAFAVRGATTATRARPRDRGRRRRRRRPASRQAACAPRRSSTRWRRAGDRGIFGKPKLARIFAGRSGGRYDADYLWTPCLNGSDSPYCSRRRRGERRLRAGRQRGDGRAAADGARGRAR